jgi:hypothetical protein
VAPDSARSAIHSKDAVSSRELQKKRSENSSCSSLVIERADVFRERLAFGTSNNFDWHNLSPVSTGIALDLDRWIFSMHLGLDLFYFGAGTVLVNARDRVTGMFNIVSLGIGHYSISTTLATGFS